jgi:hypothetical protein
MEGYAAIFAASRERKPAIVVRGVSDMTEKRDPASDKIRQPIAACHAAAFAIEVQLEEQARSEPLESYHAMLDRLWNERVLGAPNGVTRSRLASSIADLMAEEESLWLARARFEEAAADIEALIAAGILTPTDPASASASRIKPCSTTRWPEPSPGRRAGFRAMCWSVRHRSFCAPRSGRRLPICAGRL